MVMYSRYGSCFTYITHVLRQATLNRRGEMTQAISVALVGEFMPSLPPHAKTNEAIDQMQSLLGLRISAEWISTCALETAVGSYLEGFDAFWIAPGSPDKSLIGALNAVRYAREHDLPLLCTCGGCQHVVIEYARNVLGGSCSCVKA
jgi:CTP synthase (UTP-ammonia lyase)